MYGRCWKVIEAGELSVSWWMMMRRRWDETGEELKVI
jgi:hypothetical protein